MINEVAAKSLRRRHVLYWPGWLVFFIFIAGLVVEGGVFFYLLYGPPGQNKKLHYQLWASRRVEIKNSKLAQVEPYIWQQLLACSNLSKDSSQCLPMTLGFTGFEKDLVGTFHRSAQKITYYEKPEPACLICHRKEQSKLVKWQTTLPAKATYTLQQLYYPVLYAVSGWLGVFFLYLVFRLLLNRDLLAFAMVNRKQGGMFNAVKANMKVFKQNWLYLEYGENFVRGYLPKRRLHKWLKKFFTGDNNFSQRDVSAITLLYKRKNLSKISYEGLRIAQGFALKVKPGFLVMPENLIKDDKMPLEKAEYRAVWQKKNKKTILNGFLFKPKS